MHPAGTRDSIPREARRVSARDVLAITGHTGGTPVEERATLRVISVVSPVVVGEGAVVATLTLQHLLKGPGVVAVPCQKGTSDVDCVR